MYLVNLISHQFSSFNNWNVMSNTYTIRIIKLTRYALISENNISPGYYCSADVKFDIYNILSAYDRINKI